MLYTRLIQAGSIGVAVFMMATSASGTIVEFRADDTAIKFVGDTRILASSDDEDTTLTFLPNALDGVGAPSGVKFGKLTHACPTCTEQDDPNRLFPFFDVFRYDLLLFDQTGNATERWRGASTGHDVWPEASEITSDLAPGRHGPAESRARSGDLGPEDLRIDGITRIVARDSDRDEREESERDDDRSETVPEPATIILFGGGLLGLSFLRKRFTRR